MSISISQLSFEHHRSALGIAETEPRISWRFAGEVADWEQSSYDIQVKRGGKTKCHHAESSNSLFVDWPDKPLSSAEKATVRARAQGGDGQESTPWSDWVSVETGLLEESDWAGAAPIAADRETELGEPKRPIYFRKGFDIDGTVESARLYITGLGIYEAEINGERVGDYVLAPGWQSYHFRHVYDTYDVTSMLSEGENAIGVAVGEGWYSGRIGFSSQRETYGDTIGVMAVLKVTLDDGSVVEIYDGEIYNSTLEKEIEGWSSGGFDEDDWLSTKELPALQGKLSPPDQPPVRRQMELKPVEIFKSPSGKQLIDFGQNAVGWLRIKVEGPAGTNITLHHAEVLEDGELAIRPLRTAKARDTLLLHGEGPQTWEPHFTFHGFRYAQIDGWPEDVPLDEDSVTHIVIWTDMEETGSFECSHELLSKFHQNVIWSMRGNFVSIPTDCPQRDERLGWTGDAHAFGPTSNFLYNTAGFWRSWHRDVWSEMQRNGSMITPFFVPTLPIDSQDNARTYWGDVAVANPWNIYRAFGDEELLREQFDQARGWIDEGIPRSDSGLWDRCRNDSSYLVGDAYLVEMTRVLANISAALGEEDLASQYIKDHDTLRGEFQKAWIVDGDLANRTQTAYALALEFGLYTDETQRAAAAKTLRDIIAENDYLVGTGFAGTPALGPALERIDAIEDFYAMLLQTQVPSWLYQVVQNGTTTWERWDSLLPNGTVNPGEMTSFNHYAFGAVADWIHGVIGGVRPKEPGWKVIEVKPVPGGDITDAKTKFVSGYGEVAVEWTVDGDEFSMTVRVPPNARAEVTVPGGETEEVGSGVHEFTQSGFRMPSIEQ